MTEELKPCPFCGCAPLVQEIEPHKHNLKLGDFVMPDHPGCFTMECPTTNCCGMIADTREELVAAWSRRAAPAVANAAETENIKRYDLSLSSLNGERLGFNRSTVEAPAGDWVRYRDHAAAIASLNKPVVAMTDEQIAEIHDAVPQTGNWVNDFARAILAAAGPDAKLVEALSMVRDYVVTMKGMGHEYQIVVDASLAAHAGQGAKE